MLSNHGWQQYPMTFRCTLTSPSNIQTNKINLLLEQKRVIERIASLGKNFIIVGRNADIILKDYKPFNIFVCAYFSIPASFILSFPTTNVYAFPTFPFLPVLPILSVPSTTLSFLVLLLLSFPNPLNNPR